MGVRSTAGHPVYRHGGGYAGVRALLARVPSTGLAVAVLASADHTERRVPLIDALLRLLFTAATGSLR